MPISRFDGGARCSTDDVLAVEEPLEIRLGGRSYSVTMRTPGDDGELAAGFLFAEGVVTAANQILSIDCYEGFVSVALSAEAAERAAHSRRQFALTSACGVCGKESLEALERDPCPALPADELRVSQKMIEALPDELRRAQPVFDRTGGLHAAALFNARGEMQWLREDVGRHNAVDKLVGAALLAGQIPMAGAVMLVSGRASYELVQKALTAGMPVLVAVGAPSSLAVETASQAGMTLIGFLRGSRFNVYSGAERLL